jgi:hypothetical protein
MDCHPMFKEPVSKEPQGIGNSSRGNSTLGTPRKNTTPGRQGNPRQNTTPRREIHEIHGIPDSHGIQIRPEHVIVGAQIITESCEFENIEIKALAKDDRDGCNKDDG